MIPMGTTLFDPDYLPLTHAAGFLQADLSTVLAAFDAWDPESDYTRHALSGDFTKGLDALLPMTWGSTRILFWATRSNWTVMLDNAGGDAVPNRTSYLSEVLGCIGMRVVWSPDIRFKGKRGCYGATMWEVFGPGGRWPMGYLRTIARVREGRWTFDDSGTPFSFERYTNAELKEHWSKELLIEYAGELGVKLDDPAFFGNSGVMYQDRADWVKDVRVLTLEEAKHEMRIDEVPRHKWL